MFIRSVAVAVSMLSLAFLAGCQSSPMSTTSASAPRQAVLITTGNGTTAVYIPKTEGGTERLASAKIDRCPQCEADVASYFKTGVLAPKCNVCGATRTTLAGTN